MPKYIVKRVLIRFIALLVLASVTFFPMKATPESPFSLAKYKTPEALTTAEAKYSLDKPLVEQYVIHPKGVAQGSLEESMTNTGRSVSYYIKTDFPVTACLGLIVSVLTLAGGIALGIGAALPRRRRVNDPCIFVATTGVSVPSFPIAMIMLIVLGVRLHVLPSIGLDSPLNYIIPALLLAFYPIAMTAKLTRFNMLEVMSQDYIILARSKGTPYKKIVIKHALRNAMLPVMTYADPVFVFMLTGGFATESVFSTPGIGSVFVPYTTTRNYPIIMGLTTFLGSPVITPNLITDILSATIDPRIKLD